MTQLAEVPSLVRRLGHVKQTAAQANGTAGVLSPPVAEAIARAAGELAAGRSDALLVADLRAGGGGIAVHQNVNEVIARAATESLGQPVDAKRDVAASQSTADVLHTAARLTLLDEIDGLDAAVRALIEALRGAAVRFDGVPTLARTCLQDALPVPSRLLVDRPLSSHPHPAGALQHGDDLLDASAAVVGVALVAAKAAQDLRLLSSGPRGGFGEIVLPKVVEGSAFFAAKNNPVVPEGVIAVASRVEAADTEVRTCVRRAELHLAGYDLSAATALLEVLPPLAAALHAFATDAVEGMVLDEERCRALAALATPVKEAP